MIRFTRELAAVLTLSCVLLVSPSRAETIDPIRVVPDELYGGMVVNQTVTVLGRDFYNYFATAWRELPMTERYVISVHEWPSARWGSRVQIRYAERPVFEAFLQTTRANIKTIGDQASEIAYRNTVDLDVQRLFFRDPDLGRDEL